MLTKEQIEIQSKEVYSLKAYKDYARAYALGATWANAASEARIAELEKENNLLRRLLDVERSVK